MAEPRTAPDAPPSDLTPDCGSCFGLCCVVPAFARSVDFAIAKPPGEPCVNLLADSGCGIHTRLRESGFKGCTVFECFGAGQKISQVTFEGRSWLEAPADRQQMFAAFYVMLPLHELLWYLTQSLSLPGASELAPQVTAALTETERLTRKGPDDLLGVDVGAHREQVGELLGRVSEAVRGAGAVSSSVPRRVRPRADLAGASLAGADLRGASLRGAVLIGADLRGADLRLVDLLGVDLRDADVRGADLSTALFTTQTQLNAARGDASTRVPTALARPSFWP